MNRAVRDLAVRLDAAVADVDVIPINKIPGEPSSDPSMAAYQSGACMCVVDVRRRGADGRLERDPNSCECRRLVGLRVDEHGTPRPVHEPCNPEGANTMSRMTRTDSSRLREAFNEAVARGEIDDEEIIAFADDVQHALEHRAEQRGARTQQRRSPSSAERADAKTPVTNAIRKRDAWAATAHLTPDERAAAELRQLRNDAADQRAEHPVTRARRLRDERAANAHKTGS